MLFCKRRFSSSWRESIVTI